MTATESSWLKDGVEAIERLTVKATSVEPKVVPLPLEKPGTYAIVMPGAAGRSIRDSVEIRVAGPKWHNELLETPANLLAFILDREKEQSDLLALAGAPEEAKATPGVVYVGQTAIVYCYSFEDRRDRATAPLTLSKPWQWLASETKPMDQKTLIRTLRILFGQSLPQGSNLISQLRSLKFTNDGTVDANLQHGSAKLGKQILMQVTGVEAIPEEFSLYVNVFEQFSLTVEVRCALEIDPARGSFEIIPYPSQLQIAMETTLEAIRTKFSGAAAHAYLGAVRAGKVREDE